MTEPVVILTNEIGFEAFNFLLFNILIISLAICIGLIFPFINSHTSALDIILIFILDSTLSSTATLTREILITVFLLYASFSNKL